MAENQDGQESHRNPHPSASTMRARRARYHVRASSIPWRLRCSVWVRSWCWARVCDQPAHGFVEQFSLRRDDIFDPAMLAHLVNALGDAWSC